MRELIDRAALIVEYDKVHIGPPGAARKLIENAPVIEERQTGKWKGYNADNPKWLRDDGSPVFLECSACNTIVMNNGSAYWNFCPNCGADMRGEQE